MPIASSRDDIIMPCKEKVALIFLLLTCTVATELTPQNMSNLVEHHRGFVNQNFGSFHIKP